VKNWTGFTSINWAADSKGLFVSSNPAGLRQGLLTNELFASNFTCLISYRTYPGLVVTFSGNHTYQNLTA